MKPSQAERLSKRSRLKAIAEWTCEPFQQMLWIRRASPKRFHVLGSGERWGLLTVGSPSTLGDSGLASSAGNASRNDAPSARCA